MEWNEETIARLRALWAEGFSTAEIGRRMTISKNAVVGKAHRLNLPARPSPIRREGAAAIPRPPALPRVTGPTLPPLAAAVPAPQLASTPPPPAPVASVPRVVSSRPASTTFRSIRPQTCCWPIGEPGRADFRFCSAEGLAGKPYCAEHAAVAYVKARDRREDAA